MKVREARIGDSGAIAQLVGEMGYTRSDELVVNNLRELAENPDHRVVVSLGEFSAITGWLHMFIARRLGSRAFVEIGGMVVAQAARRQGTGSNLVQAASQWAREKDVSTIRVRTNSSRAVAPTFYGANGFKSLKGQSVFERKL